MVSLRRKILFFIFILLFIIITSVTILYANGYKLNLNNPLGGQIIQKTGMFILETEPTGALVHLNQKNQKKFSLLNPFQKNQVVKTPTKIKNLLPKEYEVKLELDGYWPWEKKLKILPGQITVQNVKLFKKTLPLQILSAPASEISISSDKKKIFLPSEGIIIDLKSESRTDVVKTKNEAVAWSPDNKKILAGNIIIDPKAPEKNINLNELVGLGTKNIKWNQETNKIYYQYKNSLNYFNLANKTNEELFKLQDNEKFLDYSIKNNHLFFISQNNLKVKLSAWSFSEKKIIKEINLPASEGYKLINNEHGLINLYDENYEILYLVDFFASFGQLKEIISNVKYLKWIDGDNILCANDFEIWKFNLKDGEKTLITRISQKITGLINIKRNNYLIYSTEKSINLLEHFEKEKIQIIELTKLDKISPPLINENEDALYFFAKIGNQEGLYKLGI